MIWATQPLAGAIPECSAILARCYATDPASPCLEPGAILAPGTTRRLSHQDAPRPSQGAARSC